jgi:hypothetical protein
VADAGTFLADTRVGVGGVPTDVWNVVINRPGIPVADAATVVADTRSVVGTIDANTQGGYTATRSYTLAVFAIVTLVAVIGGVAVGLLTDTREGVVAGVAAIVGGLLAIVLRNLPGGGGRHAAGD